MRSRDSISMQDAINACKKTGAYLNKTAVSFLISCFWNFVGIVKDYLWIQFASIKLDKVFSTWWNPSWVIYYIATHSLSLLEIIRAFIMSLLVFKDKNKLFLWSILHRQGNYRCIHVSLKQKEIKCWICKIIIIHQIICFNKTKTTSSLSLPY